MFARYPSFIAEMWSCTFVLCARKFYPMMMHPKLAGIEPALGHRPYDSEAKSLANSVKFPHFYPMRLSEALWNLLYVVSDLLSVINCYVTAHVFLKKTNQVGVRSTKTCNWRFSNTSFHDRENLTRKERTSVMCDSLFRSTFFSEYY